MKGRRWSDNYNVDVFLDHIPSRFPFSYDSRCSPRVPLLELLTARSRSKVPSAVGVSDHDDGLCRYAFPRHLLWRALHPTFPLTTTYLSHWVVLGGHESLGQQYCKTHLLIDSSHHHDVGPLSGHEHGIISRGPQLFNNRFPIYRGH